MLSDQKHSCWRILSYVLAFLSLALLAPYVEAQTPSTAPLVQSTNLAYIGAFKVPSGQFGTDGNATFDFSDEGLAFNPLNNSLFMKGHTYGQYVAEVSIPQAVNSTNLNSLNTAQLLQTFADITEGNLNQENIVNGMVVGGLMVHNSKLIGAEFAFYDGASQQTKSHFASGLTLATTGDYRGMFRVGSVFPALVGGQMTPIPPEWQAAFGGPALTGHCCSAITSQQSLGPSAFVFDPSDLGVKTPVPATPVVYYDINHPTLGMWGGPPSINPIYNNSTSIPGMIFPQGTRSILFFGRTGLGAQCYGGGTECGDPTAEDKGTHAYPYAYYVWMYDANDFVAVKNGTKNPWEIIPYYSGAISLPFATGANWLNGAAYDPATRRIYIAQRCAIAANCAPLIHVFSLNVGTTTTTTPTVSISANPASITSGNSADLTWSSTNTTSCTASGAWSGTKAISGSQSTGILTANATYMLACTGAGGSASQSATVTVASATQPPSTSVNVSNVAALQSAINGLTSNMTILLADGTYNLTAPLYLPQNISNVTIRGASGNRDAVIIKGPGINNSSVAFGFWADNVSGVRFQDMTIRDFSEHAIILNGGVDNPVFRNLHIIDIGDQFLKNNPTADGLNGIDNGILENSLLEYTSTAPDSYTNGLDVHRGKNWTIRNNTFKNFRVAADLAGPAVLVWNGSSDTTVVRNTFINNQRDISLGLDPTKPVDGTTDHARGIIANNFIYKTSSIAPDVPIAVFDSPQTKVYYNTVLVNGSYPNAIEYRFSRTTGVDIKNNLLDAAITARDGATATVANNITNALSALFVNPTAGDLHLKQTATAAIDKGIAVSVIDDFDGEARPQGAASDIGADEYTTSLTAPTAPSSLVLQ